MKYKATYFICQHIITVLFLPELIDLFASLYRWTFPTSRNKGSTWLNLSWTWTPLEQGVATSTSRSSACITLSFTIDTLPLFIPRAHRYQQSSKSSSHPSTLQPGAKSESLREEMEEAANRMEICRVSHKSELLQYYSLLQLRFSPFDLYPSCMC